MNKSARLPVLPYVLDILGVTAFAVFGRAAHKEAASLVGIFDTAWPFLVALVGGWILVKASDKELADAKSGAKVWLTVIAGGMIIRGVKTGAVPHWSFIIVAAVSVAVLLFAWRLVWKKLVRATS